MIAPSQSRAAPGRKAFTLIEILVVVAIMGIVMAVAIPNIYRTLSPGSMEKAVRDVMEACSHARARAIFSGQPEQLIVYPLEKRLTGAGISTQFGDGIAIEMCDVNFIEYKDMEQVPVTFYPSGMSDEFTLILLDDDGERRMIFLEVVTGLADLKTDPQTFLRR